MPDSPLHNLAGEPLPEGVDLLTLGLRALGFAICVGATGIVAVLWGVQSMVPAAPTDARPPVGGPPFYLLVFGTMGAMLLAAVTCWFVLRPVDSWFRRGGLAVVSAFASFVVALLAFPADVVFGHAGLLGVTLIFPLAAWWFWRGLRRWSASA